MLFYYITRLLGNGIIATSTRRTDKNKCYIVFEKKKIVLDLPAGTGSEAKVVDGWKILPMTYPQVKLYFNAHIHLRLSLCVYYRLTNVILSDIGVVKTLLDAPSS